MGRITGLSQYVWEDDTFRTFFAALIASDPAIDWPVGIHQQWNGCQPKTQTVAIGARTGIDANDMKAKLDACACGWCRRDTEGNKSLLAEAFPAHPQPHPKRIGVADSLANSRQGKDAND